MESIEVVIIDRSGIAKDPHPMGPPPPKPIESNFKNRDEFVAAIEEYAEENFKWKEVDKTLNTYQIHSMVCDSGIVVGNHALWWHVNKKYKANVLKDNLIQII